MELVEEAFTVLITDDDADGTSIRDLSSNWHDQGLLKEFAIVSPSSVSATEHGPALVMATVVGQRDQVELMRHLGGRRRRLIRLIVLHPLTHADSSAEALVGVCETVASLVKRAMPGSHGAENKRVRLLRMNLLAPETDLAPQQLFILQPGWEVNAVVSPEDRPDLDRLNVFIRASENLHGHALAAAATVGGLWQGMHEAAFDQTQMDSTTGAHDLQVIRCQAKLIVGDDRAARMADATVEAVAAFPNGAVRYISWGYVSDRPAQLVQQTLDRLLQQPEWAREERPAQLLHKSQVSLGQMIGDWIRFQASLPASALGFVGSQAQAAVERSVTNTFVGAEAGVIGRVTPLRPEEAFGVATQRLHQLSRSLEPNRLEEDAATWGGSSPAAWRTLRELSIGLVDGSELPSSFSRQRRSELDEVLPPSFVVPAPEGGSALGDQFRGVDVGAAAVLSTQVSAGSDSPATTQPSDSGVDSASSSEEVEEPATEKSSGSAAREMASSSEETADSLTDWVESRRDCLFWKLATRVYDNRRAEDQFKQAAYERLQSSQDAPPTDALTRARQLLIFSWVASLVLLAAGIYWISALSADWWVPFWRNLDAGDIGVWAFIVIGIFLAGGHQYYRALRKYEWQVRLRLHTIRTASDEYVEASQQEKRWHLMYEGVLDWNDILAELLHRPWAMRPPLDDEREVQPKGLPAAVALAVPAGATIDPAPDLVAEAVEAMCFRGWLRGEFDNVVTRSYANDPKRNGESGDLPADLDLGLRPQGPRRELLSTIRDPIGREQSTRGVYEVIADLAAEATIRIPDLQVRRIGEYAGEEVQEYRDFIASAAQEMSPFSPEIFADQALLAKRHVPVSTALTLPLGVQPPTSEATSVNRCEASLATRVDVSATLQPNDVRLFASPRRAKPESPATSAADFN